MAIQIKIRAMAKERQELIEKLKGIRKTLIPHIAKCLADGLDSIYFKHHLQEVIAQYDAILKIRDKVWKNANGFLLTDYLYHGIYEDILQKAQKLNKTIPDTNEVDLAFGKFEVSLLKNTLARKSMSNDDWIKLFSLIWKAAK